MSRRAGVAFLLGWTMKTVITEADVGKELWTDLLSDFLEFSVKEHRRGGTFFVQQIVKVDGEFFPNNPELFGFWETNQFIWSEQDYDKRDITELRRVHKAVKTTTVESWEPFPVETD